jgi:hypothetical protein
VDANSRLTGKVVCHLLYLCIQEEAEANEWEQQTRGPRKSALKSGICAAVSGWLRLAPAGRECSPSCPQELTVL